MQTRSQAMSFRACVYPDQDDSTVFIAHCMEMDVMGEGSCIPEAISELREIIEVQLDSCERTGSQVIFPSTERCMEAVWSDRKIYNSCNGYAPAGKSKLFDLEQFRDSFVQMASYMARIIPIN